MRNNDYKFKHDKIKHTINFGDIDFGSSKSCSSEEQLLEVDYKEGLADQVGGLVLGVLGVPTERPTSFESLLLCFVSARAATTASFIKPGNPTINIMVMCYVISENFSLFLTYFVTLFAADYRVHYIMNKNATLTTRKIFVYRTHSYVALRLHFVVSAHPLAGNLFPL